MIRRFLSTVLALGALASPAAVKAQAKDELVVAMTQMPGTWNPIISSMLAKSLIDATVPPDLSEVLAAREAYLAIFDKVMADKQLDVLVFPQIHLTNAEQLAFTDAFGERVKFTGTVPGGENSSAEDDELYKITLDKQLNPSQADLHIGAASQNGIATLTISMAVV